jgi:rod shape-determining protein MreC
MSRLNAIFLILFVGLLIWITLFQPDAVATIQRGAMVLARPFTKASHRLETAAGELVGEPIPYEELRTRLAEAERERDRLRLEVVQLDELLAENNELRKALQYLEKSPLSLAPARVISRKPAQWYSTVVIDKGSDHGVAVESPVIVPLGEEAALVGKVSDVLGPSSAVVLLLTDEKCQVSAKLADSPEQGILSGQRGALRAAPALRLRYLSKEVVAAPGTRVYSSGAGELFPASLLLGEISSLSLGVIDAEATVTPAIDFDGLLDLFVILPQDPGDDAEEKEEPEEAAAQRKADAGEDIPANPLPRS